MTLARAETAASRSESSVVPAALLIGLGLYWLATANDEGTDDAQVSADMILDRVIPAVPVPHLTAAEMPAYPHEVAEAIGIKEHSVKNYLRVVYDKLGLWNRVELALWYRSRRIGPALSMR